MSYSYHYWQHAYNLNILASIAATQLTFKGPIHGGGAQGTISHFMWGLASRLGFLTLPDKPGHRDSFGAPFGRSEGVKLFFSVVVSFVNPFFSFFEKELSAFVPRENEISMKKGEAGNFVPSEFLLWRLQGKGEESGLRRVQAKMRKEKEFLPRISPIVSQWINIYRAGSSETSHNGHSFKTKPSSRHI